SAFGGTNLFRITPEMTDCLRTNLMVRSQHFAETRRDNSGMVASLDRKSCGDGSIDVSPQNTQNALGRFWLAIICDHYAGCGRSGAMCSRRMILPIGSVPSDYRTV